MTESIAGIRVKRIVGGAIVLLSLGFYIGYAIRNFRHVPVIDWDWMSVAVGAVSITLVVLGTAIVGWVWCRLVKDSGISTDCMRAVAVFAVAQFGKYLPGNVGQYAGRVVLARMIGIPIAVTVSTMIIESLWIVAAAAALSLAALVRFADGSSLGWLASVGPAGMALLMTLAMVAPWAVLRFAKTCFPEVIGRACQGGTIPEPRPRTAVLVTTMLLVCFLLTGIILKIQAQWYFGVANVDLLQLTCLFAVAWVAGYLTPGAPGGVGVREAMMVLLLPPVVGSGVAVGLAFTLRIATTLGDLVAFLAGMVVRRLVDKREAVRSLS